jgi:hypothetical protein
MLSLRPLAPFAQPSTTTAGSVVVRDRAGTRIAEARRRGDGGRARWRWSAHDAELGTFVVEPRDGEERCWFVTRVDGAPFGQLEVVGSLRRKLVITDGTGRRLTVSAWGAVRDSEGRKVARIHDNGADRVELDLLDDVDATWRSLLLAATLVRPGN